MTVCCDLFGVARRRTGLTSRSCSVTVVSSCVKRVRSSVSTTPGQTAFTWMLRVAYSSAVDFVRPMTPCFDETYAGAPGKPFSPPAEDVLTIAPPLCLSMRGISVWMHRNTPVRFTAIVRFQSSTVQSAVFAYEVCIPALLCV